MQGCGPYETDTDAGKDRLLRGYCSEQNPWISHVGRDPQSSAVQLLLQRLKPKPCV